MSGLPDVAWMRAMSRVHKDEMVEADQSQSCMGSFFKQRHRPCKRRGSAGGIGRRQKRVASVQAQLAGDTWIAVDMGMDGLRRYHGNTVESKDASWSSWKHVGPKQPLHPRAIAAQGDLETFPSDGH